MLARRIAAVIFFVFVPVVGTGLGCKDNPAATKKCDKEKDMDTCSKCCTANGASGSKFVSGACGCLGG